jgi:hypothetical protein
LNEEKCDDIGPQLQASPKLLQLLSLQWVLTKGAAHIGTNAKVTALQNYCHT